MSEGKGVFSALQKTVKVTRWHSNSLNYKNKSEKRVYQARIFNFTPVNVRWRIYIENCSYQDPRKERQRKNSSRKPTLQRRGYKIHSSSGYSRLLQLTAFEIFSELEAGSNFSIKFKSLSIYVVHSELYGIVCLEFFNESFALTFTYRCVFLQH